MNAFIPTVPGEMQPLPQLSIAGESTTMVRTLSSASLAATIPVALRVSSLRRASVRGFDTEQRVASPGHAQAEVFVRLNGPLLLRVEKGRVRTRILLYRPGGTDCRPEVLGRNLRFPSDTGYDLLDSNTEFRSAVFESLGEAVATQVRLDILALLPAHLSGMPLFSVSLPTANSTLIESCVRGELQVLNRPARFTSAILMGALPETMARPRSVVVEVPYLDRCLWRQRCAFFASLDLSVTDTGGIQVQSKAVEAPALLESALLQASQHHLGDVRLGCITARHSFPMRDLKRFAAPELRVQVQAFLGAGGFGDGNDDLACELRISMPRQALESWFHAPDEYSKLYSPVYGAISRTVQRRLRRWLPTFCRRPYKNHEARLASLMMELYECSSFTVREDRAGVVPDDTDPENTGRLWKTGSGKLKRRLARDVFRRFSTQHLKETFAKREIEHLSDSTSKDHLAGLLLRTESRLIDGFINLGITCRALRDGGETGDARRLSKVITRTIGGLRRTIGHAYTGMDCSVLLPLLFFEATDELNMGLNRDYPVTSALVLRHPSGAEKKFENQSANYWRRRHYLK